NITVTDPKLQPLLADGISVDFAGALDQSGAVTADQLHLHAGGLGLEANGSAQNWGETASLKGRVDADDLAPLLALGGLQGHGKLGVDLSVDRGKDGLSAKLEATGTETSIGIAEIDRLVGAAPKLALAVRQDASGAITIEQANIDGAALSAKA